MFDSNMECGNSCCVELNPDHEYITSFAIGSCKSTENTEKPEKLQPGFRL